MISPSSKITSTVFSTRSSTKLTPTSTAASGGSSTTASSNPGTTTVAIAGNPFSGVALYANPYYASEISTLAIPSLTGAMATKAAAVAKVPTFVWL